MGRLTDRLYNLERQVSEYPGDSESDLHNRRLVLRKAMDAYGRECYDEGYQDGMRDLTDTRFEAVRRAEKKAAADLDGREDDHG